MNNIFLQQSKDKYNPDVTTKKKIIEQDRTNNIFKKNDIVYNSITNISHSNIKTHKDLELQKDTPLNNFSVLLAEKNKERNEQDNISKLPKQKVIINNLSNEKVQTYNELKSEQIEFANLQENEIKQNKNKYQNIIGNLKNLGILNN
tara:strand:+ start:30 stop:470 length:441 start_codon:yes stop_codon:yes gene_type:complete